MSLTPLPPGVQGYAAFEEADGRRIARYRLDRWWGDDVRIDDDCRPVGPGYRPLVMIGTNPSEAGDDADDNTVRKLYPFARREGANGLCIVNTHPAITKNPADLSRVLLPVGVDARNSDTIYEVLLIVARRRVAAWGKPPRGLTTHRDRVERIKYMAAELDAPLRCFGTNGDGSPKHPLYLPGDTPLVPWWPR